MAQEEQFNKMREFSRVDSYVPLQLRLVPADERDSIKSRTSGQTTSVDTRELPDLPDRLLNDWIKVINSKLDAIVNMLVLQREGFGSMPVTRINLSGGGIAVITKERYSVGNIVEIKMVLPMIPPIALYVYGEVAKVDMLTNGYSIAAKFIAMDEDVRDEIVKYVFRRQREILREQRR